MDWALIASLAAFLVVGRIVSGVLGKGVANAIQIAAGVVLAVMALRHFPELMQTVARIADKLWPAAQDFANRVGDLAVGFLRGR